MNDEIRKALDQWVLTVEKCIHDHTDLITKMSGNIIDQQVSITALEKAMRCAIVTLDLQKAIINNHEEKINKLENRIIILEKFGNAEKLERRIEHIETYIDPIKDFTERPITASKRGSEDDNIN